MIRPHRAFRPLLVLCASAATAASAYDVNYCQQAGGPSPVNCSSQTWVDTCQDPATSGPTDPNNPCLQPQPPDGKSFVQQAQEQWQSQNDAPTSEKVFDPQVDTFRSAMPSPPRPQLTLQKTTGATGWANQELIAQYNAANIPNVDPLTYSRLGIFATLNGIQSCEDYTYLSFKDVERWIDATNACKDDARCKVNVSLNGYTAKGQSAAPGIARRRPQNADGNYIYDPTDPDNHVTELVNHHDMDQIEADPFDDTWQLTNVPKNAFHAGTEYLISPLFLADMQAAGVPDAQGLANELARGDGLYEAGQGVPTSNGGYYLDTKNKLHQGFYDEWDFHHYMNVTTQTTTQGESREYRRRNDAVTQAWAQLADDMKCLFTNVIVGNCGQRNTPSALGKVRPGDTQIYEQDPFQTWSIMSAVAPMQMAQPPSTTGQIGFGAQLQPAQYSLDQLSALDVTLAAQNIPSGAHAPGFLSANAITNSMLLGAMNLPASMIAHQSAAQIESIAATETRLSNILAGQQGLQLLGNVGNLSGGNHLGLLNGITGINGLGNIGSINTSLLGTGSNGGAVPFALVVGGGGGNDLSGYIATYTPSDAPAGGTSYMVDRTWSVNPPRWTADANGNPILNCSTSLPRPTSPTNFDAVSDFSTDAAIGSNLTVDTLFHTEKMWVSTCQITNLILAEWYRKQAGNPSCLDMTSTACDWVPQDFVDRFVTQNVSYASAAKEIEYTYCKRWTGGGLVTDTATYLHTPPPPPGCPATPSNLISGVPQANRGTLTDLRTFLDKRRDNFECVLKTVPVKAPDDFGKLKTDGNKLGNAQFGGGYSYSLGWHAYAYRNTTVPQTDPTYNKICRLGGSMNAGFKAFATLFSDEIDIINADVTVLANENDDHKGVGWASLVIAGFTVFNQGDAQDPIDLTGSATPLDKVDTKKPQFVEAPFQVGWVTVTIKAGILFDYGAKLNLSATVPDGTCNTVQPMGWEAIATFQPQADLGVWVSADATLAGMFGVGFEVDLILVGIGLPLSADVKFEQDPNDGLAAIKFDAELDLTLTTLKGELDFYIIAFFAKVFSVKVVGWDGFVAKFPIFRTRPVYIDLGPLVPGAIHSPEQSTGSEDI